MISSTLKGGATISLGGDDVLKIRLRDDVLPVMTTVPGFRRASARSRKIAAFMRDCCA